MITNRIIAFVDGQNLYHAAKKAFGSVYPDYDIKALALSNCKDKSETTGTIWDLKGIYFYTGVPKASDNQYWNEFWEIKLLNMSRNGIKTFQRPLRYSEKATKVSDSEEIIAKIGQEKGIDVRIAVDVIRMALKNEYDVALIFSQDQDLSEVVSEIHDIAKETKRWINVACAYPFSQQSKNKRGINGSDWIQISRIMYKNCIDPVNYRKIIKMKFKQLQLAL